MKLYLSILPEELNGYINICPHTGGDLFHLECEDNSCTEIIAEILDYVPRHQLVPVIEHYVSKLRHGGSIILGGVDAIESMEIFLITLDLDRLNSSLFGNQNHAWAFKLGCTTVTEIVEILKNLDLSIVKRRLNEGKFIVEAIRE